MPPNRPQKIVQGLWVAWVALFIAILNIKMEWIYLAENIKFIPAFVGWFTMYNEILPM